MFYGSPVVADSPTGAPTTLVSEARNPRALLKINNNVIRQIDSLEYTENNYYNPDSFRVTLPLYSTIDAITIEDWLSQESILVEIFTGFPNDPVNYSIGDLQSLVVGSINDLNVEIFNNGGGFVTFNGFDLSKKLIDTKTTQKYQNQTSSQIATTIANEQGLTPVVTATTQQAGVYYNQDWVQLGNETTQWDLLTYLAQHEGFTVFARGQSLYFQPREMQSSTPYVFEGQTLEGRGTPLFNGTKLIMSRNMNFAPDVVVNVISWGSKTGHVQVKVTGHKTKAGTKSSATKSIGQPQVYTYSIPGLSKEQALQRAQSLLQDISMHERLLEISCPANNVLRKDSIIQLKGISPSADQTYYPDTITRRMAPGQGYNMEVRAKNHSPQSMVTI